MTCNRGVETNIEVRVVLVVVVVRSHALDR